MSQQAPSSPVSRPRVLLGLVVLVATLSGVIGISQWLRHPETVEPVTPAPDDGDVRDDLECPHPPAREGRRTHDLRPGPEPVTVDSDDLYDCPASYDRQVVTYEGEAVGAVLHRADGAWAQLNDDAYADLLEPLPAHRQFRGGNAGVGVYLPHELAEEIRHVGGPNYRGDLLEVTGTFYRMDPRSREAAVIIAENGAVLRRGQPIDHAPLRDRQAVGVVLALAAVAVTVMRRSARS
jgi:hypothetical protein